MNVFDAEVWNKQRCCRKCSEKTGLHYHTLNSGLCGHMVDSHALGLVASQICVTDRVQTHNSRLNIGLLVFSCQELSKRGKIYLKNVIFKRGPPTCVRHLRIYRFLWAEFLQFTIFMPCFEIKHIFSYYYIYYISYFAPLFNKSFSTPSRHAGFYISKNSLTFSFFFLLLIFSSHSIGCEIFLCTHRPPDSRW